MLKKSLLILTTLILFNSCISCPEETKPSAVFYPDVQRPKLGLIFEQIEDENYKVTFPSGQQVIFSKVMARHFQNYGAEIKAFEKEANSIIEYYRGFFDTHNTPATNDKDKNEQLEQ